MNLALRTTGVSAGQLQELLAAELTGSDAGLWHALDAAPAGRCTSGR
jgi:hypothetical protein